MIGAYGFQVVATSVDPALDKINLLGVRYWINQTIGVDVAGGIYIHEPPKGDTQAGLAVSVGVPLSVKSYKHVSFYLEPKFAYALWRPAEDSKPWRFDLGGWFGAEVTLGWIGIPRLSFLAEMGAGLTVVNDGSDSDVTLATKPGHTFPWMFDNNVGVVYYF